MGGAIGNLSLENASLTEVIDQLARQLHINYILDPAVKGGVILNTYGDTGNLDARSLLELILRMNGAGMVQEGDIYRIVPLEGRSRASRSTRSGSGSTIRRIFPKTIRSCSIWFS